MDENTLCQAFVASICNDNALRVQAYTYLESIKFTPGLVPVLLRLSLHNPNLEIQQSSVIYLKNLTKAWDSSCFSLEDKLYLRSNLIHCLSLSIPEKIRSQFEEITDTIIKHDYPWDGFISLVESSLSSADMLYSGLMMLYHACKFYDKAMSDKRKHLINLIDKFYLTLLDLLERLLESSSPDRFSYIQIVLMTFWSFFYLELPEAQAQIEYLQRWLRCFRDILNLPLGSLELPVHSESEALERTNHIQWLCRKWCAQIIHRFFTRYFNKNYMKAQNLLICEHFQSTWAIEFYTIILQSVCSFPSTFITEPVLCYFLKYISQALKFEAILKSISAATVQTLLITVCLQLLYRKPLDEELWNGNPTEFIRKEEDLSAVYTSPKHAAITLILSFSSTGCIHPFFNYLNRELRRPLDPCRKEALMLALGSISEPLRTNVKLKGSIEGLLHTSVFTEFTSSIGFLRSRAVWVYAKFAHIEYAQAEVQEKVLAAVCRLMVDAELPVRYAAAVSLPKILVWEISKAKVKSEVKDVLGIYLTLTKEIDSQELMEALESVISSFPEQVRPFAVEIIGMLIQSFEESMPSQQNCTADIEAVAAISTLNTIAKIIDILRNDFRELVGVSVRLKAILDYCVKNADFFESGINILMCLLFYAPTDSLPHLCYLFNDIAISIIGNGETKPFALPHLEEIFPVLANFITKYPEFAANNLIPILNLSFTLLLQGEDEIYLGCQILLSILETYRELAQSLASQIVNLSFSCFSQEKLSTKCKVSCTQVIFAGIWNKPGISFDSKDAIIGALTYAQIYSKYYTESLAKIHLVLGLGSLFTVVLPAEIGSLLPVCFKMLLKVCYEAEVFEEGEAQANVNVVELRLRLGSTEETFTQDDSEEDDYPYGTEPVDFYDSKFEDYDCVVFSKRLVEGIRRTSPQVWEGLVGMLSQGEVKALENIMQYSE